MSDFMTGVAKGLGEKLADKRIIATLFPALLFWVVGLGAWAYAQENVGDSALQAFSWLRGDFRAYEIIVVFLGAIMIIALSAFLVQKLDFFMLRLLEGYWPQWQPLRGLRRKLTEVKNRRIAQMEKRFQRLAQRGLAELSPEETEEYVTLDRRLALVPALPEQRMPTRIGNVQRGNQHDPPPTQRKPEKPDR